MIVCDFIREHGLEALQERTSVKAVRHETHPNLVLLKYNQIESPMGDPLVQKCRGLILDEEDDWAVVSYPYDKFFNSGEGHAAELDWASARVYEKLDGSICTLYNYKGEWMIATNGSPDASGTLPHNPSSTFRDLFWHTFYHEEKYDLSKFDTNLCYIFELMTPENRVVIPHTSRALVLTGARDLTTLKEVRPEEAAEKTGVRVVRTFALDSIEAALEAAETLGGLESEGFVVCDGNFNRQKVKGKAYVSLHHLKSSLSVRRLVELAQANEGDEFLSYFPEYRNEFLNIKAKLEDLCIEVEGQYEANKNIEVQKDFALAVKHLPYSAALFATRAGKAETPSKFIRKMDPKALMKLLKLEEAEGQAFFRH